jgi:hypothetical protein
LLKFLVEPAIKRFPFSHFWIGVTPEEREGNTIILEMSIASEDLRRGIADFPADVA